MDWTLPEIHPSSEWGGGSLPFPWAWVDPCIHQQKSKPFGNLAMTLILCALRSAGEETSERRTGVGRSKGQNRNMHRYTS